MLFCLLGGFTRLGAGDSGLNGGFTRIDRGRCLNRGFTFGRGSCVFNLLRGFTRFGASDSGFNGGFARIDRGRSFSGGFTFSRGCGVFTLLRGFTRFGAGDSGLNGGFTRIACIGCRFNSGLLFSFARPGLGFTRFAGGNRFAVIWFAAGLNDNRLRRITLLFPHAG